jgi:hypothetical protein
MWVKQIAAKVPVISKLEKKLGMLQGLDPVLEGIVSDLDKVTDFSNMIELQKKSGAFSDDEMFDDDKPAESTADLISQIKEQLESAAASNAAAKAARKAAKEAESLDDLESKYGDKAAKKRAIELEKEDDKAAKRKAIELEKEEDKAAKRKAIELEKQEEKSKIDVESDEKVKEAQAEAQKKVELAEKKA